MDVSWSGFYVCDFSFSYIQDNNMIPKQLPLYFHHNSEQVAVSVVLDVIRLSRVQLGCRWRTANKHGFDSS